MFVSLFSNNCIMTPPVMELAPPWGEDPLVDRPSPLLWLAVSVPEAWWKESGNVVCDGMRSKPSGLPFLDDKRKRVRLWWCVAEWC